MKVLLIKPGNRFSDHIQPPLGLAYIAACLRNEHEVRILDLPKFGRSIPLFRRKLEEFSPDVVGFQCYSVETKDTHSLVKIVKDTLPKAVIVIGGPHPTLCPEKTMKAMAGAADFLIRGEAERSFPSLLRSMGDKSRYAGIPGIVYYDGGELKINQPELISDLDSLPLPAWDLIKPQEYPPAQHGAFFKQFPIAPIITTRGCPFSCVFCSAPILSGRNIRKRSALSVIKEIRYLHEKLGIREIHIVDDNFTLDRKHAMGILNAIVKSRLPVSIAFPNGVRLNTLDAELLELMKKAGAYLISVGVESGSDLTLKRMKKSLNTGLIEQKIALIKKHCIDIAAFFILGFPDETTVDIKQTIDFSVKLPLLRANYFTFLPLPETPVYRTLQEKGELQDIDDSKLLFECAPYAPVGLTHLKLRNLQRLAFLRFYMRPAILFRNLMQIRSIKHFWYLVKRFYHWVIM